MTDNDKDKKMGEAVRREPENTGKTLDDAVTGDCFYNAIQLMQSGLYGNDVVLCHGQPVLNNPDHVAHGTRYNHAWLELDDIMGDGLCIDAAVLPPVSLMRSDYYRRGQIDKACVKRYTAAETRAMMLRYATYGPWPNK